jgi:hypothetical protein
MQEIIHFQKWKLLLQRLNHLRADSPLAFNLLDL